MSFFFGSTPAPTAAAFVPVSTKPIASVTLNLEQTLTGLSPEHVSQIDAKIQELKDNLSSDVAEWEPFMEDNGVKGVRKFVDGRDIARIRSEIYMPFHIVDIFDFLCNPKNVPVMDSIVNTVEYLKKYSVHSWVACTMLHGQWPVISPREIIDLMHWRLLEDGSVLFFGFSIRLDDEKPETGAAVRGFDHLKGYLLRPTEDGTGTDVHMIFDSDPRGNFPPMLINQGMLNQPTGLVTARDALQKQADAGLLRDVNVPARYEDFLAVIAKA